MAEKEWRTYKVTWLLVVMCVFVPVLKADQEKEKKDGDWVAPLVDGAVHIFDTIVCAIKTCHEEDKDSPPTIECPKPITVAAKKGELQAQVNWTQATAKDKEDGALEVQLTQPDLYVIGGRYDEGRHEVTYEATDSKGHIARCTFTFTVQVYRCPADFTIMFHGNASCTPTSSSPPVWGTKCSLKCEPGYKLQGVNEITCGKGSWSSTSAPKCIAVECGQTPILSNGRVTCTDSIYGARCPVSCDPGYALHGNDSIICNYDQQWSVPGNCRDAEPPKLQCGNDISVFAGPNYAPAYVNWTMPVATDNSGVTPNVTSDPQPGYFPPGVTRVNFTSADKDGNVAACSVAVSVAVKRCPVLASTNYANISCTHDNVYGSECNTTCHTGYELSGDSTQTCQENSTWSGSEATCQPIHCVPPPVVTNGRTDCNSTTYQSLCLVTCDQGYSVLGDAYIACQDNRQWTHPGKCKDVEPPNLQCGTDIQTSAGPKLAPAKVTWAMPNATDTSGSTPNVTSNPQPGSFFAPGVTTVNFTATDDSNNVARCSIIVNVTVLTCPHVQITNNANISCTHANVYGSECDTTCNSGYELKGNNTQTCEANGTWSGQQPQCERMSCSQPLFDLTGNLLYDCSNGYYLGESCTTRCQDGNPPRGAQVINCTRDSTAPPGHEMQWNFDGNTAPYCQVGQCPKLDIPKDGALACDYMNGIGEFCVPSCSVNTSRPASMEDTYQCLDTSTTWDPSDYVPDCQAFTRHHISTVQINPSFYYYNNTCDPDSLEIKQKFLQALSNSFVCAAGGCNDTSTIHITCYDNNNAGKRDAASSSAFLVMISPDISLGPMVDQGSLKDTQIYYDKIAVDMNTAIQDESDKGMFDLPDIGVYDGFDPGLIDYKCEAGMVVDGKSLHCAGCGEGLYLDNTTNSCVACPLGTYQDQEIAFQCTQCPDSKTTSTSRTKSVQECQYFCPSGTSSQSGAEPCDPCPRGSYQSASGMTSCDICPYGMSTVSEGSTTESDCLFYDVKMTNETSGPWIQMFDKAPQTFTLVTWVHVVSTTLITTLTFDMDEKQARAGSAYLALGDTKIFISPKEDLVSKIIRNWYHLALVYDHGEIQLYIDGRYKKTINNMTFTDLWKKSFSFVSSDDLEYVVLTHLEMTKSVLSPDIIAPMSYTCDQRVDKNILLTDKVDDTLVNPSTCDDTNDCLSKPCGDQVTCVDDQSKVQCL